MSTKRNVWVISLNKDWKNVQFYLTMQGASHTYGSFSKTFPDSNLDVTELLALFAFNFFPLCESLHRSKVFGIWKITLRFPPRKKKKFRKHCAWLSAIRDENSFKVTRTMRHPQRFSMTNYLHLNTYTNIKSGVIFMAKRNRKKRAG
jgi:hypothetical protein